MKKDKTALSYCTREIEPDLIFFMDDSGSGQISTPGSATRITFFIVDIMNLIFSETIVTVQDF